MKHAKKLASLLLALVMVFAVATTAFAADETGSITIDNAVVGQTYTIYEIPALIPIKLPASGTASSTVPTSRAHM